VNDYLHDIDHTPQHLKRSSPNNNYQVHILT
jgi:hypothetical protein